MGISRITAYVVATNEVECIAIGPVDGKYQGVIQHSKDHPRHPCMMIISSDYCFPGKDEAEKAMNETVDQLRKAVAEESAAK